MEFRRFGLVLPFGARNNHFNTTNKFLFSPQGKWLQDDLADPLESWSISDVISAGRAHGALNGDLYGCLYFYLQDQLRSFSERIRRFHVTFHLLEKDAVDLSRAIRIGRLSTLGLPSSIRFDRIDVSNIFDIGYLGIQKVIENWGPFLAKNKNATLLGYFMNWVNHQRGGNLNTLDSGVAGRIARKMMDQGRLPRVPENTTDPSVITEYVGITMGFLGTHMTCYDNSEAFEKYLASQGMTSALRNANLVMRSQHKILPHRILGPLEGKPSALPEFPDSESWYLNGCIGSWLWSERFVEISHS